MSRSKRARPPLEKWTGPTRPYDLVKEVVACFVVVVVIVVACAALFSSPDERQISIGDWARADAHNFVMTAVSELDGSSGTASYGPPYNSASDGQKIGPLSLAKLAGVRVAVNAADDFVVAPLQTIAQGQPDLLSELSTWQAATTEQRASWTDAYTKSADVASYDAMGNPTLPAGDYGPVQPMLAALVSMARNGGLDGALATERGFYNNNNYTRQMLFLADGSYLEQRATDQHLGGDQWGMMNEVGNYPGQAWLWLYTVWYQVPPFKTSGNADALIWGLMMVFTLLFVFVPFIPGLRDIPRVTKVHRLIWREHYRMRQ